MAVIVIERRSSERGPAVILPSCAEPRVQRHKEKYFAEWLIPSGRTIRIDNQAFEGPLSILTHRKSGVTLVVLVETDELLLMLQSEAAVSQTLEDLQSNSGWQKVNHPTPKGPDPSESILPAKNHHSRSVSDSAQEL